MAGDIKLKPRAGIPITLMSTELNSLASGAWVLSNSIDVDADYDFEQDLFLNVTFGTAPAAGGYVYVYKVRSDGAGNYVRASGTGPELPGNDGMGQFPIFASNTAQKNPLPNDRIPAADYKLLVGNGTNQAFPSSGSTITAVPSKYQYT